MRKRIVSGIFALAALAALGVIIGGALASGEQLIIRFLTAVIVAALALYVVSDIRLESATASDFEGPYDQVSNSSQPTELADTTLISTDADSRDLQPAARTVDASHPALQVPTVAESAAERPTAAFSEADNQQHLKAETGSEIRSYALSPDPGDITQPDDSDTTPDSTIDISTTASTNDQHQEPVYVTVGTHRYEGSFETPAAHWPQQPPVEASSDADWGDTADDGENQLSDICYSGEPTSPPSDALPLVELAMMTAEVPSAALFADGPAATTEPDDSGQALTDLARTTAAYAGPANTPVIDLREPIAEDVPASTPATPLPEVAEPASFHSAEAEPAPDLDQRVAAAIDDGEKKIIEALIRQGMLSTSGRITDRDVRTMVYVAFTSNELRKIILTKSRHASGDQGLGTVELFDETLFEPVPQTLYTGRPNAAGRQNSTRPPAPSDAGLLPMSSASRSGSRNPV